MGSGRVQCREVWCAWGPALATCHPGMFGGGGAYTVEDGTRSSLERGDTGPAVWGHGTGVRIV